MTTKKNPIVEGPVMGGRVEDKFDKDGELIQPSTIANERAEANPGFNPDFFPSDGKTREEQNAVGKGANPSADVVTKNDTSIDPVFIEPSPTADGRTVPETVPASLPVNAPITEPNGEVHSVGETPEGDKATNGVVKQRAGEVPEVVFGAEADKVAKENEEKAVGKGPAADTKIVKK